jgi:hypothetical protein
LLSASLDIFQSSISDLITKSRVVVFGEETGQQAIKASLSSKLDAALLVIIFQYEIVI